MPGDRRSAREAAIATFDSLGWQYGLVDPDQFRVNMPLSAMTWGETLTVSLSTPGMIVVESKCAFPMQIIDWGKNKRNVRQFVDGFLARVTHLATAGGSESVFIDNDGKTPVDRVFTDD